MAKESEESLYGKNVAAINQRKRALANAKGFTEKVKAAIEVGKAVAKSHLGMDIDIKEIEKAIPEESTGLYGPKLSGMIRESASGKINQAILTKSEVIEKQAELTSTPVVNKLDDVEATIKNESKQSTTQLQNTTILTSNQITSSVNDSTTLSGGGGRQTEGMQADGWYQRAIFSGGR